MSYEKRLRTAEEIRLVAKAFGRTVTAVQFESWRKRGLIPSPVRRFGGRGAGSETLGYPDQAFLHVMAVASALRHKRSLDNATWWMWLAGFDVTRAAQRMLERKANTWQRTVLNMLEDQDSTPEIDPQSDPLQRLVWERAPKWITPYRQWFRGLRREQFETVVYMMTQALSGQDDLPFLQRGVLKDEAEPFRRALGKMPKHGSREDWELPEGARKKREEDERKWKGIVERLLNEFARELNVRRLAEEISSLGYLEDGHKELEDMRDQFICSVILVMTEVGKPVLPVTTTAFLLWFSLRYVSVSGSQWTFQILRPILDSEHKQDLLDLFHRNIKTALLSPNFEELDEQVQRLYKEEYRA